MGRKRGFVDMDNAKAILEGLLFLSGEEGLSIDQMMLGLKNLEMDDIRVLLDTLKEEYSSNSRGIELVEYANRFKFVTKEFVYPYGKQLFEEYKQYTRTNKDSNTTEIINIYDSLVEFSKSKDSILNFKTIRSKSMQDLNGDDIAKLFEMVGDIEKHHEERYLKLIGNIEEDKVFHRNEEVIWICRNCGHVYYGKDALKVCPVCKHSESFMELKATNY